MASAPYAVMRCSSICPSVTFVNSVKTSNRILKFFTVGYQTILVFPYQTSRHYSGVDPLSGTSNVGGVGINRE